MSRGECSFEKKIQIANENKAQAIIIYNSEADVFTMITRGIYFVADFLFKKDFL